MLDENDAPKALEIQLNTGYANHDNKDVIGVIEEVAQVGAEIGTIRSFDPDRVDQATFELTKKSASNFKLDTDTITCKLVSPTVIPLLQTLSETRKENHLNFCLFCDARRSYLCKTHL